MSGVKVQLASPRFTDFFADNDDFDLMTHDFFDPQARQDLKGERAVLEEHLEALKPYQRLFRLFPSERLSEHLAATQGPSSIERIAAGLIDFGYDSAHLIAAASPLRFERECLSIFGGDAPFTREVRRRAGQVMAAARHAFANARSLAASPFDASSVVKYAEPEVTEYFQSLPSYQSLFGSLDYIEVPHGASIFGPAAYLLDIMRITDEYITDYNEATIPSGFTLRERRPDLFDQVKLDAATTTATLPYISLVNEIMEARLATALDGDPYETLTLAPYPFNLPFNRPWVATRRYVAKTGSSLEAIGQAMLASPPEVPNDRRSTLATTALGLCPEQVEELTTVNSDDATIGAQYGLSAVSDAMPKEGNGQIAFTKGEFTATGVNVNLDEVFSVGQRLETEGQLRTVTAISKQGEITVDVPWVSDSAGTTYRVHGFPVDLTNASCFRDIAGRVSFQRLQTLLTQQLSPAEWAAKEANAFFINHTDEGLDPMAQQQGDPTLGNVVTSLANVSPKRLDRLSRFIRLVNWCNVDATAADWLMRVADASDITPDFLVVLTATKRLAEDLRLDLDTSAAMAGPFKTSGKGDGPTSTAPFDNVFNSPSLLKGADPYTARDPIPFDPTRPLAWAPGGLTGSGVTGNLRAATASTATLATKAPDRDGHFDGFQITITKGPGAGQKRIIRTYNGTDRQVTLYEDWQDTPDKRSEYAIVNTSDLTDRLAAALSTRQSELAMLGDYYQAENFPDEPGITLDLSALTGLWRLARMASTYRLSITEYLVVRRLAGVTGVYATDTQTALDDAHAAIAMIEWLRARKMSAYELDYIENGTLSRHVLPRFDRKQTGGILKHLASSTANLRLTSDTLSTAGFSRTISEELIHGLTEMGMLDAGGLVLPHDELFIQTSADFPITAESLRMLGLSAKEVDATLATLTELRPAYLQSTKADSWALTASYPPGNTLDFLCIDLPNASSKQANISAYLDSVAQRTACQIISPLLPFSAATGFQTQTIGTPQSRRIFECLQTVNPAVLIATQSKDLAYLSATYDGSSSGWELFTSQATGQSKVVSAYTGSERRVTLASDWSPLPDAFAYYEIAREESQGQAKGGGSDDITLAQSASDDDGAYQNDYVVLTDGPGAGQRRLISAYDGAQHVAQVAKAWETAPDDTSTYVIERIVARGNVQAASSDTLTLDARASNLDDAYDGMTVYLVPDPDAESKTQEVCTALDTRQDEIANLAQVINEVQTTQSAAVTSGCAEVLDISSAQALLGMTYLDADPRPRRLIPVFLGGDTESNRDAAGKILDGLSRFTFARTKITLTDSVWSGLAREPWLYDLDLSQPLARSNLVREGALESLAKNHGTDPEAISNYLEIWTEVVGEDAKLAALHDALGWEPEDTRVLDAYLRASSTAPGQNPYELDGLTRLGPSFAIITDTTANAHFLVQVADMLNTPPLGPIGGDVNTAQWSRLNAVSSAALGVVAVRYGDDAFPGAADQLRRSVDVEKRDALMNSLIWTLSQTIPTITMPSSLFDYLLIDVEQSGCDTTSPIAQGITSVQLYMQRCRMALEPGIDVDHIPQVWWSWMNAYRLWEANRKIFLYPENYLDPTNRKSASPEFKRLESDLLQGRPTETNIAKRLMEYFNAFEQLSELVPIGACKKDQRALEGGQIDETTLIVGRTNTSPYGYYVREFTRSTLPEAPNGATFRQLEEWRAWINVDVKVDAPYVTPVWAFERLFVFWNEVNSTKSSTITSKSSDTASSTQSMWSITPHYTFQTTTGDWLSPQSLSEPFAVRVAPNTYSPAQNPNVQSSYTATQHYWAQPLALALPRGLPGAGTLSFTKGTKTANGNGTRFEGQLLAGDFIVANGQQLQVESIGAQNQSLVLRTEFVTDGNDTPFNVIPKDSKRTRYAPFAGPGLANVAKNFNVVNGDDDTRFTVDFMVGDYIEVKGEIRTVNAIFDDHQMTVTRTWGLTTPNPGKPYKIIPREDGAEKLLVFFGPNLDLDTDYGELPSGPPHENNPGEDPFISASNAFNSELYHGINLTNIVKNDPLLPDNGDITGYRSIMLSPTLDKREIRVFSPFYTESESQTSKLVRTAIDRENQTLFAERSERPLVSLYWGSSAPGSTANQQDFTKKDRALLYHINPDNATIIAINNQVGWSIFNTDEDSFLITVNNPSPVEVGTGVVLKTFSLTQAPQRDSAATGSIINKQMTFGPYSLDRQEFEEQTYRISRLNTGVGQALKQRLYVSIDQLLSLESQFLPESPFDQYYATPEGAPPPALDSNYLPEPVMDFSGSYGPYFWEIFYHAPTLIADWMTINQDHQQAKDWYEYIFNPMANSDPLGATGNDRYWRFRPFREHMDIPSLQEILTNTLEINHYNNDPFDPHAIARLRISAYAKYTVLRYVDNLITWGDALFTQDTRESITQATNLYILARDLLGRKPEVVGVFEQSTPLTYDEIKSHYPDGGIPQFLIDLENTPFVSGASSGAGYADVPINDIHAYFGVPDNAELSTYWETIDDRLYKIRHCMNINGMRRTLALFAPPLDPAALIAGLGSGGDIGGGAPPAPYPIPNYRFGYLVSVAKSLTDQVTRLGTGLLAALERKDAEALARLQLTNEAQLLSLGTEIKETTITQIEEQIASLMDARAGAEERQSHYTDLIDAGLLPTEVAQETTLGIAGGFKMGASILGAAASVSAAFPQVGSPFAMTYGGNQLGASLQNLAGWSSALANVFETANQILAIEAAHARRKEEWELQKSLAGFDIAQFDAQIAATQAQLEIAQRDLQIHASQIDQNQATQDAYKTKFTNESLYSWMAGKLASTYFQAYGLALEFARMAQRAYQFEYRSDSTYIAASYWDDLHKGLTAGEQLGQALSQLEGSYIRSGARIQNITKVISLRALDPVAFLSFLATGKTHFDLPERIFDEDFPGQYKRRIASVKVSLPAVVGPYRNIHATLTQTANRVVLQPDLDAVKFLLGEDTEVKAGVIEHNVRAYQKISLSKGQGDTGVFQPEASDSLYLPFEQTGVVSSWQLCMPKPSNLIDFESISDVILEIQYTAVDGGARFTEQVAGLAALRERQWTELIQPALQYQPDWSAFMTGPVTGERQTLRLTAQRLVPPNTSQPECLGAYLRLEVPEGTTLSSQHPYLTISIAGADPVTLLPSADGTAYAMFERPVPLEGGDAEIAVSFDLRPAYTPSSLRDASGERLDPAVLRDIQLVPFLSGRT
ncbi:neuraminidase-like domain-containing protein [Halomonas sp. EGI 63088]|uniref:Neuraminidase-like domain-containing protein n=1 Tax=Halomonas flagellata TaxID=2920385 RepID=A0ABS9RWG2_9GAMM|nr:neuraminidase-like domain-containing protein [Halomonas flagellata]MCH4564160.1 neuraminidase-like domain-containing protein [Halomonas flagellata]